MPATIWMVKRSPEPMSDEAIVHKTTTHEFALMAKGGLETLDYETFTTESAAKDYAMNRMQVAIDRLEIALANMAANR